MNKTAKPRDIHQPSKGTEQKKAGGELDENELQQVSGGKPCVTGEHIKQVKIIAG